MIYIKLVNLILIVLVTSIIGINKSQIFSIRLKKLQDLKRGFNMFQTKIEFTYEPILDVFKEISKLVYNDENNIFKSYINNIKEIDYENAWDKSVEENCFSFTKEDIDIITKFGSLLGRTDIDGQKNEIKLAIDFLDKQIVDAEESKRKNGKMYKSLGIIAGITIAIVLI